MSLKDIFKEKTGFNSYIKWQRIEFEQIKMLQAKALINQIRSKGLVSDLEEVEFSAFSQVGDDGIIQYLVHHLEITNKTFVEFGVQNYIESNTRFLLMNNNWSGLIMDGSQEFIDFVQNDYYYWKYNLQARKCFITTDNINEALKEGNMTGDIGLLHIDIDGNDYWIWKAIEVAKPVIIIMEYNSHFGDTRSITVPYKHDFERYAGHYSGLYFGVSLPALCDLATEKGYSFVGSNSYGNNAYFVRNDKLGALKPLTAKEGYRFSQGRQNKDNTGNFTFKPDGEIINTFTDMKVFNTRSGELENLN